MHKITKEEKRQLLEADNIDTFFELSQRIYPNIPMNQMDLEVLKHMDKLCKKRGRERGEDIQIPSDPRKKRNK